MAEGMMLIKNQSIKFYLFYTKLKKGEYGLSLVRNVNIIQYEK